MFIKKLFSGFDWSLFLPFLVLMILGLAMIRSVAPSVFYHQLAYFLVALFLFFLFSLIDYQLYSRLGNFFYLASLLGLGLTFIFGAVTRGSIRWIQIGGFTFQPSELAKPFLILSFASFLVSRPIGNLSSLVKNALLLSLPVFLIFWQPDLGSSLVVIVFWLVMALVTGFPRRLVGSIFLLTLVLSPLGWWLLEPYQRQRVFTFLNPFSDPLGSGYNMIQAMVAVGSGQLWGRGLGRGTQSHLEFLPERHTDFIFASLAEELGFLGSLFLILVFGFLLWRILKVASSSDSEYGLVLGVGTFGLFFTQFLVNVGMNLGMVPITGITLPFVSYGGSSLVALAISLGVMANLARAGKLSRALV